MSASVFCGCGDSGEVAMEDLPYGSTMRQIEDTQIKICFDKRFFTDNEIKVLDDYFYSIQTSDASLFRSTQDPDYISYLEKNSKQTLEDFFEGIVEGEKSSLGENFEYSYIEAVNCGDKYDDVQIEEIIDLMNTIYEENGYEETFEESITDAKFAILDITAKSGGEIYNLNDKKIFIFTFKDGIFIFE